MCAWFSWLGAGVSNTFTIIPELKIEEVHLAATL
jgi:hypothetical protein